MPSSASVEAFFRGEDVANPPHWNIPPHSSDMLSSQELSSQQHHYRNQGQNFGMGPNYNSLTNQRSSPFGSGELLPGYDMPMYGSSQGLETTPHFLPSTGASRFAPQPLLGLNQFPLPQGHQAGPRGTTSCRYTSWTGQEHRALDGLDCIEDEYDSEDEEDLEVNAATLRKLTMPSTSNDASSLANPFSWKELERSCRKLDEARIRIEEIDLTCCESDEDGTPSGSRVRYNFRLQACPEDDAAEEVCAVDSALHSILQNSRDSPANSSSGISIGASSGTSSIAPAEAKANLVKPLQEEDVSQESTSRLAKSMIPTQSSLCPTTSSPTGPRQLHAVASLNTQQPGAGAKGTRMSSIMKTVKEKCGLLFMSSARPRTKSLVA